MTRLGRWIDFENDYKTLDPSYMESVWWVFGQLWEKDLVYKGFKVRKVFKFLNLSALDLTTDGRHLYPRITHFLSYNAWSDRAFST